MRPSRLDTRPDGETLDASLGAGRRSVSALTFLLFFFRNILPAGFPWGLRMKAHLDSQHAHPMLRLIVFSCWEFVSRVVRPFCTIDCTSCCIGSTVIIGEVESAGILVVKSWG